MNQFIKSRRWFLGRGASILAGTAGISGLSSKLANLSQRETNHRRDFPDNPLVLFDNFHVGNRRNYSYPAKLNSAKKAGFDGFEIVSVDPSSDQWKHVVDLMPGAGFKIWGLHWTTRACIDRFSGDIEKDIEKIYEIAEESAKTPIEYISLSLSGNDELRGSTISESGSAKAEERHWQRSFRIIHAFDEACRNNNIRGSLYPHTHWICDTPQSQQKILEGADASTIGPAFCSHHWYANNASLELEETFKMPMMQRLNYVVLTNGRFSGNAFPAVRFDLGEIDMAWMLAMIMQTGYEGPISSQGWGIGGDPYIVSKAFVETIQSIRNRFRSSDELWPLDK